LSEICARLECPSYYLIALVLIFAVATMCIVVMNYPVGSNLFSLQYNATTNPYVAHA